jgi:hypothetical protein
MCQFYFFLTGLSLYEVMEDGVSSRNGLVLNLSNDSFLPKDKYSNIGSKERYQYYTLNTLR